MCGRQGERRSSDGRLRGLFGHSNKKQHFSEPFFFFFVGVSFSLIVHPRRSNFRRKSNFYFKNTAKKKINPYLSPTTSSPMSS